MNHLKTMRGRISGTAKTRRGALVFCGWLQNIRLDDDVGQTPASEGSWTTEHLRCTFRLFQVFQHISIRSHGIP